MFPYVPVPTSRFAVTLLLKGNGATPIQQRAIKSHRQFIETHTNKRFQNAEQIGSGVLQAASGAPRGAENVKRGAQHVKFMRVLFDITF
jgi:hypothetical protein